MRVLSSVALLMIVAGAARAEPAFERVDLVSDGAVAGTRVDASLVNPWGLVHGPDTPWWVANNATDTSTIYTGGGVPAALVVTVPGSPTGVVFNDSDEFPVCASRCSPSRFIFAGEDGVVTAWAPDVPRPGPSTQAFVVYDGSAAGSVYKGLAIANSHGRVHRLYATDFRNGRVDVFNDRFEKLPPADGVFDDDDIPRGYAPFGIARFGDRIYVTYAKQDAAKHDDVKGSGHGFVDEFDLDGFFVRRVASRGRLNSPWGMALGPESFGEFDDALLVANFGDGRIHGYKLVPPSGRFFYVGTLRDARGEPIAVDGLWSIAVGNDGAAGSSRDLYFTAGINGEADGLFGFIRRAH